ncbi:hypothetical protein B296_00016229 [Ensete ventricosum]|uniref:Uncharacterized protein n=1 Tax=Ensete ventricosum TaxID=4639 RepID=A0A426Z8E9_ENSVE|nr:hypothetical protein B296_00016229 [Ensete ventricosum]
MRRVSYEFGYQIALTYFRTKHLGLAVKEDPYAILSEDDSVPMEVEVPFDNSDQPTMSFASSSLHATLTELCLRRPYGIALGLVSDAFVRNRSGDY